jgi:predicted TIM-barrel fold metal-dependent hydrolase
MAIAVALAGCTTLGCGKSGSDDGKKVAPTPTAAGAEGAPAAGADPDLVAFIAKVKAVDNHTHVNAVAPQDPDSDALPLETIFPFEIPTRLRPDSMAWVQAFKAVYGWTHDEVNDKLMPELQGLIEKTQKEQGEKFPTWVLDKIGTEVMLANRVAMGPGLEAPRFRWVSFVDALCLPLSTKNEQKASPDRAKLYPPLEKLQKRYMDDLKVAKLPASLDGYLKDVVTATLEKHKKEGVVAVKFEAALVRSLDFADVPKDAASKIYAKYSQTGVPSRAEYKALQDYIFRHIAREAGRLGLAVHIHSFEAPGMFFDASGANPMLLEPVFNDPDLRKTNFVIIHGGGAFHDATGAMLWKPNVMADISAMSLFYPPNRLAEVIRPWLIEFPEKVLFGTDAATLGPGVGWELGAWIGTNTARQALGIALTDMMESGEISAARAQEIATMVLRGNASKLYKLDLK